MAPEHPLAALPAPILRSVAAEHVQLVLTDRSSLTAGRNFGVMAAQTWRLGDLGAKHAFLRAGLGWGFIARGPKAALLRAVLGAALRTLFNRPRTVTVVQNEDDRAALVGLGVRPERLDLIPGSGVDTDVLALRMLDEGYLLAPGGLFHATPAPSTLMRINFANTQDAAFWRGSLAIVARKIDAFEANLRAAGYL